MSCNSYPNVICLQETWKILDNSLFPLNNYHALELNQRQKLRGGGVGIYVKQHLSFKILAHYSTFVERIFESLFIEINLPNNKKIVVGNIYRPGTPIPGFTFTQQFTQFSEILSNTLAELNNNYEHVLIYGDFNLNVLELNKNKFISEYVESLFSHGFIQLITKPTRIAENSATLLDHILTNSTVRSHDMYILCSKLSDHLPIIHLLNFEKTKPPKISNESRNFSPDNILRFKNALSGYNWNHVTEQNCVQEALNNFLSTFDTLYNAFFPISTKNFNKALNPIAPWMSRGILVSRKQKNHLSYTCLKSPTPANVFSFKKYRNLYNQIIRCVKKIYFEKQLKENQKKLAENMANSFLCDSQR